jgi:hypothetical protein
MGRGQERKQKKEEESDRYGAQNWVIRDPD